MYKYRHVYKQTSIRSARLWYSISDYPIHFVLKRNSKQKKGLLSQVWASYFLMCTLSAMLTILIHIYIYIYTYMYIYIYADGPTILTHWGPGTNICVSKFTIIGSDNGLAPTRRQAIIWSNGGILLVRLLGTNLSEILIQIYTFSFKKMHLKMSSGKWRPFCFGLNVLNWCRCPGTNVPSHHQQPIGPTLAK